MTVVAVQRRSHKNARACNICLRIGRSQEHARAKQYERVASKRRSQVGGALEIVLATVAIALAVVALVVALTREPTSGRAASPPSTVATLASVRIPDVLGKSAESATGTLTAAGLVVRSSLRSDAAAPKGTVVLQTPVPGSTLSAGSTVTLIISTGAA
jgi:PASTA domain-containing protein